MSKDRETCPLSILFLLAAEILAIAIRQNIVMKSNVNDREETNLLQHADDILQRSRQT